MIFLVLAIIATLCVAEFDFVKEMKGEWEIHVDESDIEDDEGNVKLTGFLNLTYAYDSVQLITGKLKLENEEEELVFFKFSVESEAENIGLLSLTPLAEADEDDVEMDIEEFSEDEEKEEDAVEIPLKFEDNQLSFHTSNSPYSIGDNEGGTAIFTLISSNAWMFTLVDKNKKVTTYTAKRINIPQSSWLVRFGPMIMMFAVLVVPRLLGSAFKSPAVPEVPGAAPPAAEGRTKTE